jgi:hypothetical protein
MDEALLIRGAPSLGLCDELRGKDGFFPRMLFSPSGG